MKTLHNVCIVAGVLVALCVCGGQAQVAWNPYPGNPVLNSNNLDPAVIFDSTHQMYMMWYVTPDGNVWNAASLDGLAWMVRDTIALAPGPQGSYDRLITSVSAVKNGSTYFMYYTAYSPENIATIGLALSQDGIHWQKSPSSPVLKPDSGSWEFPMTTGARVVVVNGKFFMIYSGYDGLKQECGLATSTDGIAWTKSSQNPVIVNGGASSVDGKQVGAAGIAYNDSAFYLVYRAMSSTGAFSYCLATSYDGTLWQKFPGNPIYTPGGGWDSYQIGGGALLWINGTFKFWYCATSGGTWGIGVAFPQFPPPAGMLVIRPAALNFGWMKTGSIDTLSVIISNAGKDTLRVTSITSNNSVFGISKESMVIPADSSGTLAVLYTPTATQRDTGTISIASNDPIMPLVVLQVSGHGYALMQAPVISDISLVPSSYGQVRVIWFRSLQDTAGAADPVTQYSLWRLAGGTDAAGSVSHPRPVNLPSATLISPVWDFVAAVPAADLDRYGYVASMLYDNSNSYAWTTFMVAAHTAHYNVYQSAPDSIQYDPPVVNGIGATSKRIPDHYALHQNYPNPFNPSTTIRYDLPRATSVSLIVYNILGQEVVRLAQGDQDAGYHVARFDGSRLASGVYLCRLKAGDFVQTMRLVLLK